MSVVPTTKGNGATSSSWLKKISQHGVRSTTQKYTEGVGGLMGDQQWRTSTRNKMEQ